MAMAPWAARNAGEWETVDDAEIEAARASRFNSRLGLIPSNRMITLWAPSSRLGFPSGPTAIAPAPRLIRSEPKNHGCSVGRDKGKILSIAGSVPPLNRTARVLAKIPSERLPELCMNAAP